MQNLQSLSRVGSLNTSPEVFTRSDYSLSFNGTSSHVTVALFSAATTNITMSCWAKVIQLGTTFALISNGRNDTFNGYQIRILSTGQITLDVSFVTALSSGFFVTTGVWNHIVSTRTAGGTWKVYLNGVISLTTISNSPGTPTTNYSVGCGNNNAAFNLFANALIDDARFYTRELSATEVLNLYNKLEPSTTSLQCQWKFNEGSGSSATDSSGNGNTGTITTATYSTDVHS